MIIKPTAIEDIKEILAEILFSRTDKVTKITDGSVINGLLYGIAKTGQKILKEGALIQSHNFPDDAYGVYLDNIAEKLRGIPGRFGALGSSVYVRVHGVSGTIYNSGTHTVSGTLGQVFNVVETKTVGDEGFTYLKCESQETGLATNVPPLSLTTLTNPPLGHQYVINEYEAFGGRDIEDDVSFRQRIKGYLNFLTTGTLDKLSTIFNMINSNVLRAVNGGTNGNGKLILYIISQNGQYFSDLQFEEMLQDVTKYLSMSEINLDYLIDVGVQLKNIIYYPVDISFRATIDSDYTVDEIRRDVQMRINKYIDYRLWKLGQKVEWDDLLGIVKRTEGILYVPDNFFIPSQDISIPYGQFPRVRGFEMRNLDGIILSDGGSNLNPVYYPPTLDFYYIQSVLRTL